MFYVANENLILLKNYSLVISKLEKAYVKNDMKKILNYLKDYA